MIKGILGAVSIKTKKRFIHKFLKNTKKRKQHILLYINYLFKYFKLFY